jgi:DNA-binding XRE family transcriptional regulator
MPDKRREPRPAQGILGNNPTVYQLGNARALKVVRSVHPVVATFKATRLASGLSQVAVAELAGYDPATISRFERGLQAISVTKFADICAVVGLALVVLPVADQAPRV